ncbi:MAG: hypothetical protein ACREEM_03250 [Blastocatellia bacterium]
MLIPGGHSRVFVDEKLLLWLRERIRAADWLMLDAPGLSISSRARENIESLLEGVEKQDVPFGVGYYYRIPSNAKRPIRKPGVKPGTKRTRSKKAG